MRRRGGSRECRSVRRRRHIITAAAALRTASSRRRRTDLFKFLGPLRSRKRSVSNIAYLPLVRTVAPAPSIRETPLPASLPSSVPKVGSLPDTVRSGRPASRVRKFQLKGGPSAILEIHPSPPACNVSQQRLDATRPLRLFWGCRADRSVLGYPHRDERQMSWELRAASRAHRTSARRVEPLIGRPPRVPSGHVYKTSLLARAIADRARIGRAHLSFARPG